MKAKIKFSISYILIVFFLLIPLKTFAKGEKNSLWKINSYERKVNTVGQRILRANEIKEMIAFRVLRSTSKSEVNAYASEFNGIIMVERPLLRFIDNDDELAAILSHEIVHIVNKHQTKNTMKVIVIKSVILPPCVLVDIALACVGVPYPFFTHFGKFITGGLTNHTEQKYELDADDKAVDLMVKAGYNPIYMESIFKKMLSDGTYLEFLRTHPKGSIRIENVHRKIATDYPEFLEQRIDEIKKNREQVKNDKEELPVNNETKNVQNSKKKRKTDEENDNLDKIMNYYN